MENISHKVAALGGVISTTDISSEAEYKRIHRAAQRGELLRLRSGVYASPDALLDTMLDIDRIIRWKSFLKKINWKEDIPFASVMQVIKTHLKPMATRYWNEK